MDGTTNLLVVKIDKAPKVGRHSAGSVTYVVLRDTAGQECLFAIVANDGGGYFSREHVAFGSIEGCLTGVDIEKPISAKVFKGAFVSGCANNAGFLVAALRHEGLLLAAVEAPHQHRVSDGWSKWRKEMLARPGKPYVPGATLQPLGASAAVTSQTPEIDRGRRGRKHLDGGKQLPTGAADDAPPR